MTKSGTIILVVLLSSTLFLAWNLKTRQVSATEEETHCWGLIVQGYGGPTDYVFEGDSQYMYHFMSKHYMFDEICYLAIDTTLPGVTNKTSRENVSWAITEWLHQRSDANDMIFIFFATHGIGHNHSLAIFDTDGDEGDEVLESTIVRDVNHKDFHYRFHSSMLGAHFRYHQAKGYLHCSIEQGYYTRSSSTLQTRKHCSRDLNQRQPLFLYE